MVHSRHRGSCIAGKGGSNQTKTEANTSKYAISYTLIYLFLYIIYCYIVSIQFSPFFCLTPYSSWVTVTDR
jgi:hypothetical protein